MHNVTSSTGPRAAERSAEVSRLRGQVVVITGASSGIGRETARQFARHQTRLVLAARNVEALRETAADCAVAGSRSLVIAADVTDATAMSELARKAVAAFGQIDVWISNAGIGLFGPFVNAPIEQHRRVVETNLFGAMNGAAAVLPHFLQRGRGVLITNVSLGGFAPVPFAAAYTAGKFGLRGFLAALRQELVDTPGIRVCAVFPAVIDTPGFQHGANVSDVALAPPRPLFPPAKVAAAMVGLALHPRDEVPIGWPARLARVTYGLAPRVTERAIGAAFRHYVRRAPEAPRSEGNLFTRSTGRMSAQGGWRRARRGTRSKAMWWAGVAGAAGAGTVLLALAVHRRRLATV